MSPLQQILTTCRATSQTGRENGSCFEELILISNLFAGHDSKGAQKGAQASRLFLQKKKATAKVPMLLTPSELKELIHQRKRLNHRARRVAGDCWDWVSRKTKSNPIQRDYDLKVDAGNSSAKWNLSEDGSLWIVKPDSVSEVGCIHTCQGLELDYVGVGIGPYLVVHNGVVATDAAKRSSGDSSIKGDKGLLKTARAEAQEKADLIIKNTDRTLMTRGSMNRRIPNGSWCLFRNAGAGSREGKIVLVQSRDIQDSEMGGRYTVKRYSSEKLVTPDGWQHQRIILSPDSDRPNYQPIVVTDSPGAELQILGEYVATL